MSEQVPKGVLLSPPKPESLEELLSLGVRAEELGYEYAWVPEGWGRDAVTTLGILSERTDRIALGTNILPVFSRTPALVGQTAATLQEATDGRFRLGIGPSGPNVIEGWHGVPFDRPLKRIRETIEIVRLVVSGESVDYDGEVFDLSGMTLYSEAPAAGLDIDIASLGPKAVELTGRFADGWHPWLFTPEGLRDRYDQIRHGAELGDRDPSDVRVSMQLSCCTGDDPELARSKARKHVAFYIGAMGTYYRDSIAEQGYEDLAHEVHDAWQRGDRDAALDRLDDDLIDRMVAAGTPEDVHDGVEQFASLDVIDSVLVTFPPKATREELKETVEVLAETN